MDSQLNVALGIKGVAYSSNFLYNNFFSLIFTNTEVRSIKVLLCNIHQYYNWRYYLSNQYS